MLVVLALAEVILREPKELMVLKAPWTAVLDVVELVARLLVVKVELWLPFGLPLAWQ